jgi:septal ring factor EnvC (AmiA/AmiB activator)
MSNWFEQNATKSVIGYTLLVAGATWAVSTFVLQDNRLNLVRTELEAQRSQTEQYKAKAEILQTDLEVLRADNAEYRAWLGQAKDAIPAIAPRIRELNDKIAELQLQGVGLGATVSQTARPAQELTASLGRAYVDDGLGIVFTVKQTTPARTADVIVKLPDQVSAVEATIDAGKQWRFVENDKKYVLTVTEVSFYGDSVSFRVAEAK